MNGKRILTIVTAAATVVALCGTAISAQDKYSVQVPGGISFSECKGYESWELISISQNGPVVAAIIGNPAMIAAYKAGIPGNGKPVPDGARMAKIHWLPNKKDTYPGPPTVAGKLVNVDCMAKESKRFADSGGWGYGAFDYDAASDTFKPADETATPPQGHDAKCGFGCHTVVKARDYVFTEYAQR